ncbi:alcohol dehydrogenase catalytic domain-containing protein [uncultured Sphingorhabdus sp.]|uniref:alcohol dehydrogenase catalytic domain-containing protein n=1 Tax=uncultured Sphingorhabdus sp. TaxID=1686106 RepID=UPI00261A66FE|nr:alcohol dehydrogenase catalytic domain-containing protein [uncultured Sphingorhabdus sp.]HMS20184.1 alcohol dehydrogenase catalytic domain-containing protein [Sphingorhabdus sp.]
MSSSINQLTFLKPGSFEWREVAAPKIESPTDALVRPLVVARCDLDLYIATGFVPMAGPFGFGHEMVGEVIDAGEGAGVQPGRRVIVPFQISCGSCDPCRRGFTASCRSVPAYSAFGLGGNGRKDFGGAIGDYVKVPFADHMLVPVPDAVDSIAAASAADNIPDGWRAVAPQLAEYPGASVLIVAGLAQSVGLYAAGAAVALGAGRVLYLDDNPDNRARAIAMGASAEPLGLNEGRDHKEQFEIVVEAAGTPPALAFAIQSCAPDGILTSVSIHLGQTTPVPLTAAYYKGLRFQTSRASARRWLPDVVDCIACGKLHPEHVTHRTAKFSEAPDAMLDNGPKLIFLPD